MTRVIAWGSYDESKPRVRLLLAELKRRGVLVAEINIPLWDEVRDKAVASRGKLVKLLLRLCASYPAALIKLLRQPSGSAILLAYPAIPDVFAAWPAARLRRQKIVLDAFIPLHDTLVGDRQMFQRSSMLARLAWGAEWLALKLADLVIVDTPQHGDFFAKEFGIARERFHTILVGAEPVFWEARCIADVNVPAIAGKSDLPTVLFYGQLIPLHGIDTILEAIRRSAKEPIRWLLIGSGQEEPKLRVFLSDHRGEKVTWLPWVDYELLPAAISAADVVLGVFGTSDKAARVIPNKVFQALAGGKPVITRQSPAVAELVKRYPKSIVTVPPGDGAALAQAVRVAVEGTRDSRAVSLAAEKDELGPKNGVEALLKRLDRY